jgi:quercetin dioxygenase-like cupin family protein
MRATSLLPGVLKASEGELVRLSQLGVRFLLRGEQTGGRLAAVEHPMPPRSLGAPVHTHPNEDEISYVAEGTVGVQIGDQVYTAVAGDTIFKPRGIPHAFWNPADVPARVHEVITPAGFECYFEEAAALFAAAGASLPDPAQAAALQAKFGLQMDFGSIPRLVQAYGLAV